MIEYSNPWFRVLRKGDYYMVDEPDAQDGAAVLPLVGERLLLLEQRRPAHGRETLEIPRGYAKPGESTERCALRELREETGLQALPNQLTRLGYVRPNTAILTSRVALFVATLPGDATCHARDGEAAALHWVPVSDIPQWLASGRLEDGFTLAALALFMAGHSHEPT